MSVLGSMYAGISGLTTHSQSMSVIGNNLANVSTIGFKGGTAQFEDIFYSTLSTGNGFSQVGHGATVSTIYTNYGQGPYESSTSATDLAVGGDGFFNVTDPVTGNKYYTRAGNFTFDQNGYLVDPHGYVVQGWQAAEGSSDGIVQTVGSLGDIKLTSFQSPPEATTRISMQSNLDKTADDNASDPANPFFSTFSYWDGQDETPMPDDRYGYQNTITVYDEGGSPHDITIYFDNVDMSTVSSNAGGNMVYEFVVTCDPTEDGRELGGQDVSTTSAAGLLMTGTITFNGSGQMVSMSAYTLASGASGDLKDLSNWTPAEFSEDGYPTFTANFAGEDNASATNSLNAAPIELDFGLQNDDTITNAGIGAGWSGVASNAAMVGTQFSYLNEFSDPDASARTFTAYDESSSTIDQDQDGFPPGFLQDIAVNNDGVVTAKYSNGQTEDLFILALSTFDNLQGLNQEGGNLFSETQDSGSARTGTANTAGLGSVNSGQLEQSNVDTATEMVRMITIQRGYSANGKVITTADSMLQEAVQLKR